FSMDNQINMSVKIKTVSKAIPPYSKSTNEIIHFLDIWLHGQDERFVRKVKKIFENAAVDKRYSMMPPMDVFSVQSFEERNNVYIKEGIKLGKQCLQDALIKADWKA